MTLRIGYIGLGALGRHLAGSLLRAGFPVTVYDVDASCSVDLGKAGATCASSIAETARTSDTIITCLPSPEAVAEVVAGQGRRVRRPRRRRHLDRHEHQRRARAARLAALRRARSSRRWSRRSPAACIWPRPGRSPCWSAAAAVYGRHRRLSRPWAGKCSTWARSAGRGDQGDHQHARLHPPRRRRRGAHAGQAGRDRPRPGLGGHQGQLRQQLRPRDRGPADPERQLQHRLHDGPGPKGPGLRAHHGREFGVPLELASVTEQHSRAPEPCMAAARSHPWSSRCSRRPWARSCAHPGSPPSSSRSEPRRRLSGRGPSPGRRWWVGPRTSSGTPNGTYVPLDVPSGVPVGRDYLPWRAVATRAARERCRGVGAERNAAHRPPGDRMFSGQLDLTNIRSNTAGPRALGQHQRRDP